MSSMIQIVPSPVARGFTAFAATRAQNRVPSLRRSSSSEWNASPRASAGPASRAERGVGRLVRVEDEPRLADELAGLPAAELLGLPVGALHFPVAGEDDADGRVVEQRALIEEHAGELLLRPAAAGDVAQGPDRLHRLAGGAERLAVDRAPEGGAVAAADLELGVPGLAARRLGAVDRGDEHRRRLADQVALRVAEHAGAVGVGAHDPAAADEEDPDLGVVENEPLLVEHRGQPLFDRRHRGDVGDGDDGERAFAAGGADGQQHRDRAAVAAHERPVARHRQRVGLERGLEGAPCERLGGLRESVDEGVAGQLLLAAPEEVAVGPVGAEDEPGLVGNEHACPGKLERVDVGARRRQRLPFHRTGL